MKKLFAILLIAVVQIACNQLPKTPDFAVRTVGKWDTEAFEGITDVNVRANIPLHPEGIWLAKFDGVDTLAEYHILQDSVFLEFRRGENPDGMYGMEAPRDFKEPNQYLQFTHKNGHTILFTR